MKTPFILSSLLVIVLFYTACTEKGALTPVAKPVIDTTKVDSITQITTNINYDTFYGYWYQWSVNNCEDNYDTGHLTVYIGYENNARIAIFSNTLGDYTNNISISASINDSNSYTGNEGDINNSCYYAFRLKNDTLYCNFIQYCNNYCDNNFFSGTYVGYQTNPHKPTR